MTSQQGFEIRRDLIWQAPLLLLGAVSSNSWVRMTDTQLEVSFGVYKTAIDIVDIESVEAIEWEIWRGIGIRLNLMGRIALVGSTSGVVRLKLRQRSVSFLGIQNDTISISLVEPEAFVSAINAAIQP